MTAVCGRDAGGWGFDGKGCVGVWREREPGFQWKRLHHDGKLGVAAEQAFELLPSQPGGDRASERRALEALTIAG